MHSTYSKIDVCEQPWSCKACRLYTSSFDKDHNPIDGVNIKFVSEYDEVTAKVNEGVVEYSLIEDQNYMVYVDDPRYTIDSFPMTMKDKSEWGAAKVCI